MLTLNEVDVPIAAAESWPAGTGIGMWAIVSDVPTDDYKFALTENSENPDECIL